MIKPINGMMDLDDCRNCIEFHAKNINKDISSKMVNSGRITSLRALLNLFEEYNEQIEED